MKNWFQKHMIAVWAICSILFAIIIHLLFHWETDSYLLQAKWSAGDILTYVSTVALGLLALWQNKRFKEENDISQVRLERLTEQANELSMINNIISIETDHLSRLKHAIDEFSDVCDPYQLTSVLIEKSTSPGGSPLASKTALMSVEGKIDECFFRLQRELGLLCFDDNDREGSFNNMLMEYFEQTRNFVTKARKKDEIEKVSFDEVQNLIKLRSQFFGARESFVQRKESLLRKTIYGGLSLDEIKLLYRNEYGSGFDF